MSDPSPGVIFLCGTINNSTNGTRNQRALTLARNFPTVILYRNSVSPHVRRLVQDARRLRGGPLALFHFLFLALRLRRRYQVIHTEPQLYAILLGWLAKKLFGYVWVYDLFDHPSLEFSLGRRLRHQLKRLAFDGFLARRLCRADLWIVGMQEKVLATLPACGGSTEILKVTNGVEVGILDPETLLNRRWPKEEGRLSLTYSGWVRLERGMDTLLRFLAADEFSEDTGLALDVTVFGKTDKGTLAAIEEHNRVHTNRISYLGLLPHEQSLKLIEESDICLCLLDQRVLNYRFAYPLKLFEYLGAGSVVIASRTQGIAEIIEDGRNGFLVDDYLAAGLGRALSRVMQAHKEGRLVDMRRAAVQTAMAYRWEAINKKISTGLRQVCQRGEERR